MIVSFHPLFEADKNITCAGREPGDDDLSAIQAARAVILPQGCSQSLYEMAAAHCEHVFPNYDARFNYPGKIGQIELFRETATAHPRTEIYQQLSDFRQQYGDRPKEIAFELPCVFKFDWGGEGETVYLIDSLDSLEQILQKAADFEKSGQNGFLLQEFVPTEGRTLRVVIIGQALVSYWRIQEKSDGFVSSVAGGARISTTYQPELQKDAKTKIGDFCQKTGINLAGFDVIYSADAKNSLPLLLEINYFFGRKGLGGSDAYYKLLTREIHNWLSLTLSEQAG